MGVRLTIVAGPDGALSEPLAFELDQARVVIGRGAGVDVRIPHLSVSESHASLRDEGDGYVLVDQGSTNGTKINGVVLPLGRKRKLVEGDRIEVGACALTFQASLPIARPTTAERTSELARRLFRQWQKGGLQQGPRLVVLQGAATGKTLVLPEPPARALLGSAATCQLVLEADDAVAPEHCELVRDLDGVLMRALDQARGFDVNGRPVTERRLHDGDELRLGGSVLLFEEPADELLHALSSEPDAPVALIAPPPAAAGDALLPDEAGRSEPTPSPRLDPPPRSWDGDMLVYGLAALVIAVSVLGLFALLRD